jgi:hypothetical protein
LGVCSFRFDDICIKKELASGWHFGKIMQVRKSIKFESGSYDSIIFA